MAKLVWTDEALGWLREIGDFIAEDSPESAVNVLEGIYQKAQLLIDHPRLGFQFTDIDDREIRSLIYGHYRIVYEVRQPEAVYILAIFHGAMDIDRLEF